MRKMLGLSFLGETREGEHWVIADVHLKGVEFDTGVSVGQYFSTISLNGVTVLAHVGRF